MLASYFPRKLEDLDEDQVGLTWTRVAQENQALGATGVGARGTFFSDSGLPSSHPRTVAGS